MDSAKEVSTPEQFAEELQPWTMAHDKARMIRARDQELSARHAEMGPCGKHPKMFWKEKYDIKWEDRPANEIHPAGKVQTYEGGYCTVCAEISAAKMECGHHGSHLSTKMVPTHSNTGIPVPYSYCTICQEVLAAEAAVLAEIAEQVKDSPILVRILQSLLTPARTAALDKRLEEARREESAKKDLAYVERDRLVCALSKLFPASLERHPDEDKEWENDWRWIVFIDLPTGQATWHIHDSELYWFDHLQRNQGRKWDGHTTSEKYERLRALPLTSDTQGKVEADGR